MLDPTPMKNFIRDSVTCITQSTETDLIGSLYSPAIEGHRPIKPGNANRDLTCNLFC